MKAQKADVQRYVIEIRFPIDDFSFHVQMPPPLLCFLREKHAHTFNIYTHAMNTNFEDERQRCGM